VLVALGDADSRCGGKAAHLARLLRAGFDVPPGFVVLDALDADAGDPGLRAALRDLGVGAGRSVAVRSSAPGEDGAEASFAGQLSTALRVTTPERVVAEVRRVAASGRSPGAVAYAARMGREPAAVVPVIVQAMVAAETAGVLFTRHPVTGAPDVVVEAGTGLGEDVVGGTVTPQAWTVDARGVIHRSGGPGTPLTGTQVRELAAVGRRIERLSGCPQDVEWAIADGTVWVLQSRPLTTTARPGPRGARHLGQVLATGTPGGAGTAEGPARVVEGLDDFARFRAGDVLVCRTTSPAWTPLLARAAAVVTETGGVLAHAAIVAREFGIPAVLAVTDATRVLTDGQRVVVDGARGTVATTGSGRER
jgi:pyruvate,water dikinase